MSLHLQSKLNVAGGTFCLFSKCSESSMISTWNIFPGILLSMRSTNSGKRAMERFLCTSSLNYQEWMVELLTLDFMAVGLVSLHHWPTPVFFIENLIKIFLIRPMEVSPHRWPQKIERYGLWYKSLAMSDHQPVVWRESRESSWAWRWSQFIFKISRVLFKWWSTFSNNPNNFYCLQLWRLRNCTKKKEKRRWK